MTVSETQVTSIRTDEYGPWPDAPSPERELALQTLQPCRKNGTGVEIGPDETAWRA
ncbi:GTP cyclohydrolase IIa [Natrinema gelatinilyticum]|uniref:GTP cyclohydrolase IIa n=1 Tax=Natrinema gelatinilyticum TaxID=2961571 RepID=UPI0020C42A74|nr:GTP cyclohydrolase IIa [Natrinema gelatinilyticum]